MKIYSKLMNKHIFHFGIGLFTVLLGAFLLFCGMSPNSMRRAYADESEAGGYTMSLEGLDTSNINTLTFDTDSSAYLINSVDDLRAMAYLVNNGMVDGARGDAAYSAASYRLTNYLDLSSYMFWEAIGTLEHPFTGNFDGAGYSIYGLTIIDQDYLNGGASTVAEDTPEDITETYRGLFGYVKYDGTQVRINNLGLKDTLIKTSGYYTGSIVARAEGDFTADSSVVLIEECYNTGYVEGSVFVGGLVGSLEFATIKNSYNAPSPKGLSRYGISLSEELGVAVNASGGSAGGLAGSAMDKNNRVIDFCYNASVLGIANSNITADEVNLGALVGNKTDITVGLLKRNFFLRSCLPNASLLQIRNEGGSYTSVGSINRTFLVTQLSFEADCSTDSDLPKLDDGVPAKIWQQTNKTNNSLPFLYNTPQLVRIDFDATILGDAESILSSDLSCFVRPDDIALKSGNSYFVKFKDATISTRVVAGSDASFAYKFASWQRNDYASTHYTNPVTSEYTITSADGDVMMFPYNDMKIVARYTEREYSISVSANDNSYLSQKYIKINDEITTTAKLKFYDTVSFEVEPSAGYKVNSWSALGDSVTMGADKNTATFDTSAYISAVYATQPNVDNIIALNVDVTLAPEIYTLEYEASRSDCSDAAVVKNTDATSILNNGDNVAYHQTIYLTINSTHIAPNYKFAGWSWQVVDNGATPIEANWIAIEESREDSIDFVIPDLEEMQTICFRANFTEVTYKLSINSPLSEGGEVYLCDELGNRIYNNEFAFDQIVYVKVATLFGYHFDAIMINDVEYTIDQGQLNGYTGASWLAESSMLKFNSLTHDVTVEVAFIKNVYAVSFDLEVSNSAGSSTTITADSNVNLIGTTLEFDYMDVVTFTVNLEDGYEITNVWVNNQAVSSTDTTTFNVAVLGHTNISVSISLKTFRVNLAFAYDDDYMYEADSSCLSGSGEYRYNASTQVAVNLPNMFVISKWFVNGQEVNNPGTTMLLSDIRADQNIVVELSLKKSTITFGQIGDNSSGSWYSIFRHGTEYQYVNNIEPMTLNYGEILELNIDNQYFVLDGRNTQFVFAYWQINGISQTSDRFLVVTANGKDMLVEAVFRPAQVAVSADTYLFNTLSYTLTQSSEAGRVSGLDSVTSAYGATKTVVAVANNGYQFLEWQDSLGNMLSSEASYTFTVDTATRLNAIFVKVNQVIVVSDSVQGSVTGIGQYVVGDVVNMTATPSKGYKFVSWNENGVPISTTSTFGFYMPNNDVVLTAVFEAVYLVAYSVNDDSLGQVIGNTTGKFKENITLEAISANNCSFVGWMVDNIIVSTSNRLNISLNGDVEIKALFKKNFDWNIIIVLFGCALFALVMVYGAIAYIRTKEARPINARAMIGGKDDRDIIKKSSKSVALRDEIMPVPTRRQTKANIQPVPVRKIVVAPSDHKGNKVNKTQKAKDQKSTLSTDAE